MLVTRRATDQRKASRSTDSSTDAGLDGMAIGLINYIDEFPHIRDEVLPRMERLGIREAMKRAAA